MQIGYIGLGKMGKNMVIRISKKNHQAVVYNRSRSAYKSLKGQRNIKTANSLAELVDSLKTPRTIIIMVSHQAVGEVLSQLTGLLQKGDTVIDAGNTFFQESINRHKQMTKKGLNYLDIGVSGGPGGALNGACIMVGGEKKLYQKYVSLFEDLCVKDGYSYMGQAGAGHFAKMVHNGIEYGMMQAIAEGFDVLKKAKDFNFDLKEVARLYNRGSVIESRLVGWLESGFKTYGTELKKVTGKASASGEGQWTVLTAKKLKVPVKVIEDALKARQLSQKKPNYQAQVVSVLRNQFGQHSVK